MIENIRSFLAKRLHTDQTTDLLAQMSIDSEKIRSSSWRTNNSNTEDENEMLGQIINTTPVEKVVEGRGSDKDTMNESRKELCDSSHNKVMKNAEGSTAPQAKPLRFLPNRYFCPSQIRHSEILEIFFLWYETVSES